MRPVDGLTAAALQRLFEATTELVVDLEPGALADFPMAAEAATDLCAAVLDHFRPADEIRRLELVPGPALQHAERVVRMGVADYIKRVRSAPTVHDIPSNHVRRIP